MAKSSNGGAFWREKRLDQLSREEWELLCDGCAKCCLIRLEDEADGAVYETSLACRLLDRRTRRCTGYGERHARVPSCLRLTPETVGEFDWLPGSCAYRLVARGEDLPEWHHLVCGDRARVRHAGAAIGTGVRSETEVPEGDWQDYLIESEDDQ